jgi:Cof subfamily protein (haloacid dehalogenase superfamily)
MSAIRLVATDLDGTLLRTDKTISARTSAAMRAVEEAGITVVWATARARQSVQVFAEQANFTGMALCANGAVVLDLAGGGRVVRSYPVPVHVTQDSVRRIREAIPDVYFALVGADRFVAERRYAALSRYDEHHRSVDEMELSDALGEIEDEFVKIVVRHPDISPVDLFDKLRAMDLADLELTHSLAPFVEMSAAGISKAFALAALAEEMGRLPDEVAAIGDALNDVAMLEWAGTAIVPANAIPEVRAISARVVPSNDEDGVATYLESLLDLR